MQRKRIWPITKTVVHPGASVQYILHYKYKMYLALHGLNRTMKRSNFYSDPGFKTNSIANLLPENPIYHLLKK